MTRKSLLLICIVLVFAGHAQRKMLDGQVSDQQRIGIPGVHVRNLTIDKITVSSEDGSFRIPAQVSDTLLLTSVGFRPLKIVVENNWFDSQINLTMVVGSIELDEVTINSIPSIELFKERVANLKLKDPTEFWYFGIEKPVMTGDKMVETNKYKSPLFAILQPTSFLYYNFSKKEKEKRKIHSIIKSQPTRDRAYKKFNREWVQKETGLEGDKLTDFIAFCDYDIDYLDRTSLYIIKENMMTKLEEFKEEGKG